MVIISNILTSSGILSERFFAPLVALFGNGHPRSAKCRAKIGREFDDLSYTAFGILRAVGAFESGRHALQSIPDMIGAIEAELPRATWFDALANKARLEGLRLTDDALRHSLTPTLPDQLAQFSALDPYEILAGDGHWHAPAIHDAKDHLGRGIPVGHIYFKDLRSGLLRHHAACAPGTQEHDMKALERASHKALTADRANAKRRKTLVVYDRAAIKFPFWNVAKGNHAVYLITRMREDLVPQRVAFRHFDNKATINERVVSDELVHFAGKPWRLIELEKSGSPGETIRLLSNEMHLEPGLLGLLYQMRWDIERTFDTVVNKLKQVRAWASSPTAKTAQAHFICMAHNLLIALEAAVEKAGIHETAEQARRDERSSQRLDEARKRAARAPKYRGALDCLNAREPSPELLKSRKTTLTVKFLRWLRSWMFDKTLGWQAMLARLAQCRATL